MDAGDLKVFEAVARLGGMNRAAAELSTVQSNVTARIQALEADIGCALFERHSPRRVADRGGTATAALCRQGRRGSWRMPGARRATTACRAAC